MEAQLETVIGQMIEANKLQMQLDKEWRDAVLKGDHDTAERLEIEIDKQKRLAQRLEVQREAIEIKIKEHKELTRAENAAKLKANADNLLAETQKQISQIESLANALRDAIDAYETVCNKWKEARYFAIQAGTILQGLNTQENETQVRNIAVTLEMAKIKFGNIAKEISRISAD